MKEQLNKFKWSIENFYYRYGSIVGGSILAGIATGLENQRALSNVDNTHLATFAGKIV